MIGIVFLVCTIWLNLLCIGVDGGLSFCLVFVVCGEIVAMGICIVMLPFIGHVDHGGCGSASFVGLCILPCGMFGWYIIFCISLQIVCLQRRIYICSIAYLITVICWERNLEDMEGSLSFCMFFPCRRRYELMICVIYSSPLELLILFVMLNFHFSHVQELKILIIGFYLIFLWGDRNRTHG